MERRILGEVLNSAVSKKKAGFGVDGRGCKEVFVDGAGRELMTMENGYATIKSAGSRTEIPYTTVTDSRGVAMSFKDVRTGSELASMRVDDETGKTSFVVGGAVKTFSAESEPLKPTTVYESGENSNYDTREITGKEALSLSSGLKNSFTLKSNDEMPAVAIRKESKSDGHNTGIYHSYFNRGNESR